MLFHSHQNCYKSFATIVNLTLGKCGCHIKARFLYFYPIFFNTNECFPTIWFKHIFIRKYLQIQG